MSRGLGKVQRRVLQALEAHTLADSFTLAAEGKPGIPSNAQLTTVRRALSSLQRRGLAFRVYTGHDGRGYWANRERALIYAKRRVRALGESELPAPLLDLRLAEKRGSLLPFTLRFPAVKTPPTSPKGKDTGGFKHHERR